jgi:hypothetical protein
MVRVLARRSVLGRSQLSGMKGVGVGQFILDATPDEYLPGVARPSRLPATEAGIGLGWPIGALRNGLPYCHRSIARPCQAGDARIGRLDRFAESSGLFGTGRLSDLFTRTDGRDAPGGGANLTKPHRAPWPGDGPQDRRL